VTRAELIARVRELSEVSNHFATDAEVAGLIAKAESVICGEDDVVIAAAEELRRVLDAQGAKHERIP